MSKTTDIEDYLKALQRQLNPATSNVENTFQERYFEKFDDAWKPFGNDFAAFKFFSLV